MKKKEIEKEVADYEKALQSPVSFYLIRVAFADLFDEVFSSRFRVLKMLDELIREKGFKSPGEVMSYLDKVPLADAPSCFDNVRVAIASKVEQLRQELSKDQTKDL